LGGPAHCGPPSLRHVLCSLVQEKPFLLAGAGRSAALIGLNICGISSASPQAATIFITDNLLYSQIDQTNVLAKSGTEEDGILQLYADTLLLDTMVVINKGDTSAFLARPNHKNAVQEYEVIWPVVRCFWICTHVSAITVGIRLARREQQPRGAQQNVHRHGSTQ